MSRNVAAALFSSADGVVESPNLFQFDSFDERMGQLMGQAIAPVEDVVMGRVTYSEWAGYWPGAGTDDPFAAFINPVAKHIASTTLSEQDVTWNNSTLISGDVADFVRTLKAGDGGDILIAGSLTLVRDLFVAGLIDTLTLMVHPVAAGSGRRLFDGINAPVRMTLISHEITPAGNIVATYAKHP